MLGGNIWKKWPKHSPGLGGKNHILMIKGEGRCDLIKQSHEFRCLVTAKFHSNSQQEKIMKWWIFISRAKIKFTSFCRDIFLEIIQCCNSWTEGGIVTIFHIWWDTELMVHIFGAHLLNSIKLFTRCIMGVNRHELNCNLSVTGSHSSLT